MLKDNVGFSKTQHRGATSEPRVPSILEVVEPDHRSNDVQQRTKAFEQKAKALVSRKVSALLRNTLSGLEDTPFQ